MRKVGEVVICRGRSCRLEMQTGSDERCVDREICQMAY